LFFIHGPKLGLGYLKCLGIIKAVLVRWGKPLGGGSAGLSPESCTRWIASKNALF
jgi:hypothetical protein